ncbi:hypothetical protein [Burkholderia sp. 22PA0106]|uniref:hypothetical protein n=1 Tax=Burkholderia sp. 22PA0106 TaxID=3237371 RepID=UPI0039C14056
MFKKRAWRRGLAGSAILVSIMLSGGKVCAGLPPYLLDVASGYGGCGWIDNGNGTSTISVDVSYKDVSSGFPAGKLLYSRSIVMYIYDKSGRVKLPTAFDQTVYLNGERNYGYLNSYSGKYTSYNGSYYLEKTDWRIHESYVANYRLVVKNSYLSDWPAVTLLAANRELYGGDFGAKSGAVYIRYGESNGVCEKVTNPDVALPLDIKINMTAPDWSLGELPRGDSEKTFPEVANQLCFTYSGPSVKGKRFIIDASNANGVVGNRYRLKNMSDASQFIPYDVALLGSSAFSLPNATNVALTMSDSGKTCFVPTFKTTVDSKVKEGDYSDVLTFTVVTQP